ncbi:hypothetical protein AAFF_G00147860 [Aldrovandia affinis]|uniref:Uncharacterized protein n=1 Tax=Aldrovandia affinis TaxID=143900 RepID=A0AAD7RPM8_9TELE|nr:hypothetical protein AAFF_G00147860 [Aldrovandia affinis]
MGYLHILGRIPMARALSPWWEDTFYEEGTQDLTRMLRIVRGLLDQTEYHLSQAQIEVNLAEHSQDPLQLINHIRPLCLHMVGLDPPRQYHRMRPHGRRQGGKPSTTYHVEDNTPVGKVSAKQFLSSASTKDEPTVYLAKKALQHFKGKPKVFIVTSRQDVHSNCMDVQHLHSSQEKADTRNILQSLDAV